MNVYDGMCGGKNPRPELWDSQVQFYALLIGP